MRNGKRKVEGDGTSRERTICWDNEQTKFMLDWYIECKKSQHAGFQFKKQHHLKCADALNKEFAMGVTLAQVDRHYRHYKENWKIVEIAMNKSGNGFDAVKCKVTISESEKNQIGDRARRLLSKPIKFFHEMEELFKGSNADGSLAMDQQTCLGDGSGSSSDDSQGFNDTSTYPQHIDLEGNDSDTLPSPLGGKMTSSYVASGDISSSSKPMSSKKRPRAVKSPGKKQQKQHKSRSTETTEEITATMKSIRQSLDNPPPPPQLPQLVDPHATLWPRLEAIPIVTEHKVLVGEYLARADQEGMRNWLSGSSDDTLRNWVYQFICRQPGHL